MHSKWETDYLGKPTKGLEREHKKENLKLSILQTSVDQDKEDSEKLDHPKGPKEEVQSWLTIKRWSFKAYESQG